MVLPEAIDPDIAVGNQWDEAVAENCHRQSGKLSCKIVELSKYHLLNEILLGEFETVQQVSLQDVTLLSAHADIEPVEELRGDHGEDGSQYWDY